MPDLTIDKNVRVPMRDGALLAADVYLPGSAGPHPTLLMRLPYNKESQPLITFSFDIYRAVRAGYAVVVQDTRGRYASEGTFTPFVSDAADGADTIGWIAAQPWSSGDVGMVGGSYPGATQWLAASAAPPALKAIAPFITPDQYYESWTHQGGAFQLGFNLNWALAPLGLGELTRQVDSGAADPAAVAEHIRAIDGIDALYERLPLKDLPELASVAPYYFDWLAHPTEDAYWQAISPRERFGAITAPALNMGGWFDIFLKGTIASYTAMKRHGATEHARTMQRLVIGPWGHGPITGWFPQAHFGVLSGVDGADITGLQLRWFDHLLRGVDNGVDADKPVRIFVMGANTWRDEDDWPLPGTTYVDLFLHSDGRANTSHGDGRLSTEPAHDDPADVYLYDPRNPVPTVGGATNLPGQFIGANAGPRDQREVELRHDVLCYTGPVLTEAVEVIGPIDVVLFVSSSATDTDFTAKLVDVAPDGRAVCLADGIARARYRNAAAGPEPLVPGEVYELRIDLVATANLFAAGHRIRVDISSSNFPRFDRNTNTGGVIADDGPDDLVQAVNRIHHSARYPSRLVLPVVAE